MSDETEKLKSPTGHPISSSETDRPHHPAEGMEFETQLIKSDNTQTLVNALERIDNLEAVNKQLLEALNELIELQDYTLSLKARAENINAPEDETIKEICERIGYGAVMDSAERQWYMKDNVGCLTTYHCFAVVNSVTEKVKQAIAAAEGV